MSRRKKKEEKKIVLSTTVRQKLGPMVARIETYITGLRDALNVPATWVILPDQQGIPAAFVPPPNPPTPPAAATPAKAPKKAKKKGKRK